jgi:hypothetical protein
MLLATVWACGKTNSNPADARTLTDNTIASGSGGSVSSTDAFGSAGVASDASDTRDETAAQVRPTSDAIDLTPDWAASDSGTADLSPSLDAADGFHSDLALGLDTRDAGPRDPMPELDASDASISVDSPSARNDGASMDSPEDDAMAEKGASLPCADPQACTDFPAAPILDVLGPTALPADPGSSFTVAPSGSGPCVTEPEDGSLFPYNWTRPRIKWTGTSGLAQITVHADIEAHDLVVYTTANSWVMDAAIWKGLAAHVRDADISVTVRLAGGGASTVKFRIAPAAAPGSIVFWAADPSRVGNFDLTTQTDQSSYLQGFTVGESGTTTVLKFSQIAQPSRDQSASVRPPTCMGCHAATPDPGYVAFVDNWPWNQAIAGARPDNAGSELPDLSIGGLADMNKPWAGAITFSPAVWRTGARIMVTTSAEQNEQTPWSTDNRQPAKLVWYNLDSPAPPTLSTVGANQQPIAQMSAGNYGVIARTGDSNGVAFPSWSHDGTTVVYSSTKGGCQDGRLQQGATDLYAVPFAGGLATPIPGASDPSWEEYYADHSADDRMLAFDRVPAGEVMYANPHAELYMVPLGSAPGAGTAIRLTANDPVQCTGLTSPGINNHYPRWAPAAPTYNGRTYYWLVYASNRAGIPAVTSPYDGLTHAIIQIYLTAVTLEDGIYTTHGSIYVWWQSQTINTTPVWSNLAISSVSTKL